MDKKILDYEQQKLVSVQNVIDGQIDYVLQRIGSYSKEIKEALEYAVHEKIDDMERLEVYGEINMTDANLANMQKELMALTRVKPKPFFARIDLKSEFGDDSYYIGLKNIQNEQEFMVLDWRAPISSLFYYSSLGKASYDAPAGKVDVELKLKRQFRTAPNKIVSYIDTNTKINDEILQTVLSENTTSHMSNIVETIQEEQNLIIRKNPNQTVIINGVAGSGKTSIAMHRIAYVLFANKGSIQSKNILIVSPNKLFSKYIEDVLPELGEENVATYTMMNVLRAANLAPKSFGSKADMIKSQFADNLRKQEIDIKFSNDFKHQVDEFLLKYDIRPYLKFITINGSPITIQELKALPYNFQTPNIYHKFTKSVENLLIKRYPKLSPSNLDKVINKIVAKYLKLISPARILSEIYNKFNLHFGEGKNLGYEDAPIYAYINSHIKELEQNYFIKHIFVDEMQDYDPFSIALLTRIYPKAVMTLAGDYNQNIMSGQSNLSCLKELFPSVNVDNLDVSYRSSYEISEFANLVIGSGCPSSQLIRHGDAPSVYNFKTDADFETYIYKILFEHPKDKIAILTKTEEEAVNLANKLEGFTLIKDESDNNLLTAQHIISTIYLSKGLEYDRVVLPNINESNFFSDLDKQNLYVACTRALHGLHITYNEKPSKFIPEKYLSMEANLSSKKNDKLVEHNSISLEK